MTAEDVLSISVKGLSALFRRQVDVTQESANACRFDPRRVSLTQRLRVRMQWEQPDAQQICRRFFLQFLFTGG